PAFTGAFTARLPAQPPPPIPCVLPFQAPCTPPEPPSSELSGSPTRMLMFWLGLIPYSTFTWQYETFGPLAATMVLVADFTIGFPASPFAGSVASSAQCTGTGGDGSTCLSLAAHGAD